MMPTKGSAVFMVFTDLSDGTLESEFNAWYDSEHLPEMLGLPGFLDAARYVAVKGGPKYLAMFELESIEAINTKQFKTRKRSPWALRVSPSEIGRNHTVVAGQQINLNAIESANRSMAPVLQIGRMSVPEAIESDWNCWYNEKYIAAYRKVSGVICARRFSLVQGGSKYMTIYELENENVSNSEEWRHQREHSSPDTKRMRSAMTMAAGSPGIYHKL